jgi:hypothetical protein
MVSSSNRGHKRGSGINRFKAYGEGAKVGGIPAGLPKAGPEERRFLPALVKSTKENN